MKVAAVSWKIKAIEAEQDFFDHLEQLVHQAGEADLIVLPELPVLELLSLHADAPESAIPAILEQYAPRYENELERLEREVNGRIVGGSHIRANQNVSLFQGRHQPKNILTQWESAEWNLTPGGGLFPVGAIGVTICYDVEFPAAGRALAEAGVLVHCVPSYTETRHGFQRVRWSCQARAIENQIFVIHAALVGSLGREPVPATYGSSAILTPNVPPFPDSAILAETPVGEEAIAFAELDLETLLKCRDQGDVRNWNDRDKGDWRINPPVSE